ncbi:hypothetical protein [Cedecea sp. NFIX57]|uniref:hypothetical protein n=1 Tax=Cedecea sp. NFIX57 TaxID=1566286 RepID=UPI000A0C164F|nr:hypothetical protein [Cedecea sp. NFIX57]SMG61753.1 hypothetical protein SAMN03159353_105719 [Cedecea sp. NFIX57]
MTLEERVEALEDFMGKMNIQQQEVEAVREIVKKTTNEVIANARRAGGILNAAHNQAARKDSVIFRAKEFNVYAAKS